MSSPAGRRGLSVVIVNYQSWNDVAVLVTALARSPLIEAGLGEILVVDNDSRQEIPNLLRAGIPGVRLLLEATNWGFSAGVNVGWRAAQNPWLLVLNPDVVPDPDFLAQVMARVESVHSAGGSRIGVVGFGLRNADGSRQPSVGVFPSLFRTVWEQVLPRSRRKYQPDWRLRAGRVDWVTGACFLVASDLLAAVGGMDEDFFLYHEEVALCREATRRGWMVAYDPTVTVVHLRPLQNRAISPKMRVIIRHSKLLYFRKFLPGWQARVLAGVIRVEARLRAQWCLWRGKRPEERAWRLIGWLAEGPQLLQHWPGWVVHGLARQTEDADEPDRAGRPRPNRVTRRPVVAPQRSGRSRGTRPTSP